jgi:Histidine-specific methyltransferase, SAM-dependent
MTDATTLIELGSGTSDKTRLLLDALAPRRFVPFDVSEETLRTSAQRLAREYPTLEVLAVVGAWGFIYSISLQISRIGRRARVFETVRIDTRGPNQIEPDADTPHPRSGAEVSARVPSGAVCRPRGNPTASEAQRPSPRPALCECQVVKRDNAARIRISSTDSRARRSASSARSRQA